MAEAVELVIRARNETTGAISEAKRDLASLDKAAQDAARTTAAQINVSAVDNATPTIAQVQTELANLPASAQPVPLTAVDQTSPVINSIRDEFNNVAGKQLEITANDQVTPVLARINQEIEAGSEAAPIDIAADDNATPVLDNVKKKLTDVEQNNKPVELAVDDKNWRAPIDNMLARLDQMQAKAKQVQSDLGKLESKPVSMVAQDNASPAIDTVKQALSGIDDVAGGAAKAMGGFGSALSAVGAAAGVAGIVALADKLGAIAWDLGRTGASFQELQLASDALGQSFGVNSRAMLAAMKAAADGTVSDSDLMLAANRAVVTGVTTDAQVMARLLTEAKARADAFGLSSAQGFDILVTGIGNAAPRMLKQLGYTIDLTQANEAYARSIGVTSDRLTEQQQRAAILQAVLAQSGKIPSIDSAADAFERMDAAIKNARDALGVLFGPAIAAVAQQIANMANATTEVFQNMNLGVNDALASAAAGIGEFKRQLQEVQQQRAEAASFNAPTARFDAEISGIQSQISSYELLQTTIKQAADAYRAGVAGSGDFLARANELAAATQNGTALTDAQRVEISNLNQQLSQATSAADAQAAAQRAMAGAMASTNPAIDTQVGKLQQLWIAAAGALGASAAFQGFQESAKGVAAVAADAREAAGNRKAGDAGAPTADFLFAQQAAQVSKQIDELQKKAQEPITLQLAIKGVSTAAAQKAYQDAVKGGQDVGAATVAANNAAIEVTAEVNRQVEAWQAAGYNASEIADFLLPGMRQQITATNSGLSDMQKRFDSIKSTAQGVLKGALDTGTGVNPDDILAKMGKRPDAVNENARRLAAIAQNGLQGQDWLPKFQKEAPGAWADLMLEQARGGDVRAAAAKILKDFQDGLRPDLLDKEKAKDLVKRAILGDQNTAALAKEIATDLSKEMGISLQDATAAANKALGVGGANAAEGAQPATITLTPNIEFGEAAQKQAEGLGNKIKEGLGAEASVKALKEAGESSAKTWGEAFLGKVGQNVPQALIDMLTSLITPKVQAALTATGTQTGATP